MPITRKALLLSNPGEDGAENYVEGVNVDIVKYKQLLMSNVGGAWEKDEIWELDRPDVKNARFYLNLLSAYDYVFILFTGHGWYSSVEQDRILELRKGQEIRSIELSTGTKRRTVVIDSCQKVHHEPLVESLMAKEGMFSAANIQRTPNREKCRKQFFDSIVAAPGPLVRLFSCRIGEVSSASDTEGSYFVASLVNCADAWVDGQAKRPFGTPAESYSVIAAHQCATIRTHALSGDTQHPTAEQAKTAPYFPFAVFAD